MAHLCSILKPPFQLFFVAMGRCNWHFCVKLVLSYITRLIPGLSGLVTELGPFLFIVISSANKAHIYLILSKCYNFYFLCFLYVIVRLWYPTKCYWPILGVVSKLISVVDIGTAMLRNVMTQLLPWARLRGMAKPSLGPNVNNDIGRRK